MEGVCVEGTRRRDEGRSEGALADIGNNQTKETGAGESASPFSPSIRPHHYRDSTRNCRQVDSAKYRGIMVLVSQGRCGVFRRS